MNKNSIIISTIFGCLLMAMLVFATTSISNGGVTTPEVNTVLYVEANSGTNLESVIEGNSGYIFIPCGDYEVTGAVSINSNSIIEGAGNECVYIKLADLSNTSLFNIDSKSNITVRGVTLDHNGNNQMSDQHNLRIVGSSNITIDSNSIINAYHHNINGEANEILITNNYIALAGRGAVDGGGIVTAGNDVLISNNIVVDHDFVGIQIKDEYKNGVIDSNIIYWNATSGALGAIAVMADTSSVVISNNVVNGYGSNQGSTAIRVSSSNGTIVDGNQILNLNQSAGLGIWLNSAENCIVSNNKLEKVYDGIYVESKNCLIDGNHITQSNSVAIELRDSSNATAVTNNYINDFIGSGITTSGSADYVLINGNYLLNGSSRGIESYGDHVSIIGNFIVDQNFGLRYSGSSDYYLVDGNTFIDNAADISNTSSAMGNYVLGDNAFW